MVPGGVFARPAVRRGFMGSNLLLRLRGESTISPIEPTLLACLLPRLLLSGRAIPPSLTVVAAGLLPALLVLFAAARFLGRRKTQLPPPPKVSDQPDPPPRSEFDEERRAVPRRRGVRVAVRITFPETWSPPSGGWVIDRSSRGLCLAVARPVERDTLLSLRPEQSEADAPGVKARVRYCRKAGRHYYLGCQFVDTPPWSVLLRFG
jgi:hypothetical protein